MPNMQELCSSIHESIIYSKINVETKIQLAVPFCKDDNNGSTPSILYLCTPDDFPEIIEQNKNSSILNLLICDADSGKDYSFLAADNRNIVVSNWEFRKAAKYLALGIQQYEKYKKALDKVLTSQGGLEPLLKEAVNQMDGRIHIYVLSDTFQVLASCTSGISGPEAFLKDIKTRRDLNDSQISFLRECIEGNKGVNYDMSPVHDGDVTVAYLMIIEEKDFKVPEFFKSMLRKRIANVIKNAYAIYSSEQLKMQKLLSDMLLLMPQNIEDLNLRLHNLAYPLKAHIRFLIIAKGNSTDPIWPLVSEIEKIFSNHNITVYDGYIIVILSGDSFLFRASFDENRFKKFLKENNAYGIFSIPAKFIRGIRTGYIQAKELLPKLPNLMDDNDTHYVYFEDVYNFYRVHLSVTALKQQFGHNRIAYLVHPVAVQIIRYDKANNTDYFSFIYNYSKCSGNINDTASMLHMHRNSVYNKLKKIEDLFGIDFDEGALQRDIIFAMHVIKYSNIKPTDVINYIEQKLYEG